MVPRTNESEPGCAARDGAAALPSYHLFEKSGERFVYDCGSGVFFHVDEPTHDMLRLCLTESVEDAKAALARAGTYPDDLLDSVAAEVKALGEAGLFDVPEPRRPQALIDEHMGLRYSTPWRKVELALAETCNLACTYCYCGACRDVPREGFMSREVAKKAIDWLFEASEGRTELGLTLFGGEPLLNREVFDFVMEYSDRLAKEHGKHIRYTMTTNGTLLDDEAIDQIKSHRFGLMVSLDGPPEVHNRQCPFPDGRGSYDEAAAGIRKLMARRKRVTVRCTITNATPRKLDLIRFFEDFGFTRIVMSAARTPFAPTEADCDRAACEELDRQEEEEVLPWVLEELEQGRIPKYFPYSSFLRSRAERPGAPEEPAVLRCGACRSLTTVGADGTLYPCHRFVGMSAFKMGTVDTGPDMERIRRFWHDYHEATRTTCEQCWAEAFCVRPCPWNIARQDGTFVMSEEWHCDLARGHIERSAWMLWWLQTKHPDMYKRITAKAGGRAGQVERARTSGKDPEMAEAATADET